ncbi:hypothetical protein ELAK_15350 [Elizabethkingia anophelis]|nr:hypothetical protein ELAK_15350 [Elizabethkingia anophelis]
MHLGNGNRNIYHIKVQNIMKLNSMNVTDRVAAYLIDGLTKIEMIDAFKRAGVKRELSTIEKIINKLKEEAWY